MLPNRLEREGKGSPKESGECKIPWDEKPAKALGVSGVASCAYHVAHDGNLMT